MKSFDSRAYSVNDFVEWDAAKQLELNPSFQRRSVWSPKAKSYLMDTILRGKPIPKVFMRQKINVTTRTSIREVVDGQQRLRTILSYVKDGFPVLKVHNEEYGGMLFIQIPEDIQAQVLSYEVAADLLINLPDAEILDIFGRLNSYAVVLNEQERINATHFSAFKLLADRIGYRYNQFWSRQKIISDSNILRMQEISLVADLLIAMHEGIKSKRQIKRYYAAYEDKFDGDVDSMTRQFDEVIQLIAKLYPEGLAHTEFRRIHLFYSLFTAVTHCLHGLRGMKTQPVRLDTPGSIERARNGLDRVGGIFIAAAEAGTLTTEERTFVEDSRRATTDGPVRERRAAFLLRLMV